MYYEINVSHHGKHFFATADRSLISEDHVKRVLPIILEKFPENEGYEVNITLNTVSGRGLTEKELKKILK